MTYFTQREIKNIDDIWADIRKKGVKA